MTPVDRTFLLLLAIGVAGALWNICLAAAMLLGQENHDEE